MRLKFSKSLEFFFKKNFLPQSYLVKKRLERSIKKKDENEIELIKKFIDYNTDSIDVGVYRGVYSYEMAKYSKTVHSFEPNPVIFKDLEKNIKKIIKNIQIYNLALSEENKEIELKIPIRDKKASKDNYEEYYQLGKATIHKKNILDEYESFKIKSIKLDDIKFQNRISFIKIDVEGHEENVIAGSLNTINKFKPTLLIEIEEKYTQKNVSESINYINSLGYNSFVYKKSELINTDEIDDLNKFNNFIFKYK